ncbi:TPA: type VI secretion system tip protein VgrG [Klebsiella aerogenes]|nr:type VI secretion system tip protein VgrG [Klebsiella aerogenes]HBY1541962.1 type VI secretion system tip protein VgrG [Klebsiella aerogenes]HBY1606738.1 type VI secretion system tip protein VgrG [Klebsiella aerogenes]HBY1641144.1 type VI secretion system tip protein VgrG [Klebsiella aerogenes]
MVNRISILSSVDSSSLLFWKFSGQEKLSEPFHFQVDLLSQDFAIDRQAMLGKNMTVAVPGQWGQVRYLSGKITAVTVRAEDLGETRYAVYQTTLEPDLWPMMRDRNFRIFQQQRVPDIVAKLFSEHNVKFEDKLTRSYRQWEYCVQYAESSFHFISRLLELEGISYLFRHDKDGHTLVLMDDYQQAESFPGYETIPWHAQPGGGAVGEEGISQLMASHVVTPGLYSTDDYDFRKPHAWMLQTLQNPVSPTPGKIDVYDWPGRFMEHGDGEAYARIRQQSWQAEQQQTQGIATATGIVPGHTFTLAHAPNMADNAKWLVVGARYDFEENQYASGGGNTAQHRIAFTVIPAATPFVPASRTDWPRTYGPQTARVVGPKGESIWTDKYGRIKVKFHWDRESQGDENSSCWVRVSSAWAGQGYGGVQIPRVGDEVVVDFINGEPDRPIVIGRVYNEASMPPWALPAAATQMGFMSRSKDGSPDNANALRFEDKPGEEQLWLHAERNMDTEVENDETHDVGNNRTKTVGKDETSHIKQNRTRTVDGNESVTVGKDRSKTINGNETTTVEQNRTESVKGNETLSVEQNRDETISGNHTTTVKSDHTATVEGKQSLTVVQDRTRQVQGNESVSVQQNRNVQVTGNQTLGVTGNHDISVTGKQTQTITSKQEVTIGAGRTLSITGGDTRFTQGSVTDSATDTVHINVGESGILISNGSVEITAGGSTITINAAGVMVNGKKIELNA